MTKNEPMLTVLMVTTPTRAKLRAAAWAALAAQANVDANVDGAVEILVLADGGAGDSVNLSPPTWAASLDVVIDRWPTLTAKLNAGFKVARAPFVTFWDDDDWSGPSRLNETLSAIDSLYFDIAGPTTMLRHELLAHTRRTFAYTSPAGRPIHNGMVIRRELVLQHPFVAKVAKANQHDVGDWLTNRIAGDADIVSIEFPLVAMMGDDNMNVPRSFRVSEHDVVLDGPREYKLIGARGAAIAVMGEPALAAFEAAAAR